MASRTASLASRAPRAILLLSAALAVLFGVLAATTPAQLGLGGGAPSGSASEAVSETLAAELGYEPQAAYLVLLEADGSISSGSGEISIETVTGQIATIEGVGAVLESPPSESGAAVTLGVHLEPGVSGSELTDVGDELAAGLDAGGLTLSVAGPAAVGDGARSAVLDRAPQLVLLVLPLVLLVLAGALGLRPALVALLGAVLAAGAAVTALRILGAFTEIDAIAIPAAGLLAAVLAVESSAGLLHRYREESATLGAGGEALEYSLHVVLKGAAIAMFSAALIGVALLAVSLGWVHSIGIGVLAAAVLAPPLALAPMAALIAQRAEAEVGEALPLVAEGAHPEGAGPLFRLLLALGRGRARGLIAILPLAAILILALPLRDDAEAVGLVASEIPSEQPAAESESALAASFGGGATAPIIVLTDGPAEAPTVTIYRDEISRARGVESVGLALTAGLLATFETQTIAPPGSLEARTALDAVAAVPSPSPREIGGSTAELADSADLAAGDLPLALLVALLGTAALWSLLFRSAFGPLLALSAAIAPLAGIAATIAVFGLGKLTGTLDYTDAGGLHLETYVVVGAVLLAVGLTRGAQLGTALREERLLGGGAAGSLARAGLLTLKPAASATIVGAALAGVWIGADLLPAQEIGFGLAVGLIVDLLVTRLLLAPALARLAI